MKACYDITGMNCAACSAAVERAVKALDVQDANVNLLSGVLTVDFDEKEKLIKHNIIKARTEIGRRLKYS